MHVHASRLLSIAFCLATALSTACGTDVKGNTCPLLDMGGDDDGDATELYCPDPDAPEDCRVLHEDMVAAAVLCAENAGFGELVEDLLRAEMEQEGVLKDCDNAMATDISYDECQESLAQPECEADGTVAWPDSCRGAILIAPKSR